MENREQIYKDLVDRQLYTGSYVEFLNDLLDGMCNITYNNSISLDGVKIVSVNDNIIYFKDKKLNKIPNKEKNKFDNECQRILDTIRWTFNGIMKDFKLCMENNDGSREYNAELIGISSMLIKITKDLDVTISEIGDAHLSYNMTLEPGIVHGLYHKFNYEIKHFDYITNPFNEVTVREYKYLIEDILGEFGVVSISADLKGENSKCIVLTVEVASPDNKIEVLVNTGSNSLIFTNNNKIFSIIKVKLK